MESAASDEVENLQSHVSEGCLSAIQPGQGTNHNECFHRCPRDAAVSDDGGLKGYGVVHTAFKQEDGWRIGPIFANDSKIARNLYRLMHQ